MKLKPNLLLMDLLTRMNESAGRSCSHERSVLLLKIEREEGAMALRARKY